VLRYLLAVESKAVHTCQIGTSVLTTTIPILVFSMMKTIASPATMLPSDLWMDILEVADPLDVLSLMQVPPLSLSNPSVSVLTINARFHPPSTRSSAESLCGSESSSGSADQSPFSLGPIHSIRCHWCSSRRPQQHLVDGRAAFGPT